jgi:hypothetical protein
MNSQSTIVSSLSSYIFPYCYFPRVYFFFFFFFCTEWQITMSALGILICFLNVMPWWCFQTALLCSNLRVVSVPLGRNLQILLQLERTPQRWVFYQYVFGNIFPLQFSFMLLLSLQIPFFVLLLLLHFTVTPNMQPECISSLDSNLTPSSEVFEKLIDARLENNFHTSHRRQTFITSCTEVRYQVPPTAS